MSIFDIFVAEVRGLIEHPIYIFTIVLPCLLGIFILIKFIDFILYYYAPYHHQNNIYKSHNNIK